MRGNCLPKEDWFYIFFFFFQAEDGIRDADVTGVQTCALPILGIMSMAVGTVLGALGNFSIQLPEVWRRGKGYYQRVLDFKHPGIRRMVELMLQIGRASCRERV